MEKPENANTPTMGGQCSGAADIYVVTPKGCVFAVKPGVSIDPAWLESVGCRLFFNPQVMAEYVMPIWGPGFDVGDVIHGSHTLEMNEGGVIETCGRGIADSITDEINQYMIDFEM